MLAIRPVTLQEGRHLLRELVDIDRFGERNPTHPACSAFCSSPTMADAVKAATGTFFSLSSAFSLRVSVRPSMPGSERSIRIRSGVACSSNSCACSASPAVSTT